MPSIERAIVAYLNGRRTFLNVAGKYPAELKGNDNMIGRVSEYLALKYLRKRKRAPRKTKKLAQRGYDLVDGRRRISVKLLTNENKGGRGVRMTDPWDELILIQLDTETLSYRIGHLTKMRFAVARRKNRIYSKNPIVKTTMLGEKGLIGRYGVVHEGFSL